MTRHARNCTAGAVYTYHEKKKDTQQSGYGSQRARLSKDSIKDFDCCCLTLQPCKNPVVTPDGYIYDKEAILEYILHQKREIARQLKAYDKQRKKFQEDEAQKQKSEKHSKIKAFVDKEKSIVSKPLNPFTGAGPSKTKDETETAGASAAGPSTSTSTGGAAKDKQLPSFWIPSLTPKAEETKLKKPEEKVRCPMSGRPLKMKDLIPVVFKPVNDRDNKTSLIVKQVRYVCAVTGDALGNSVPCAVLKPSGAVVTMDSVERLIKKDMTDPVSGDKLTDRDIIPIQRGGTGFASSGVKLEAKQDGPVMQA
ncbi:PREDICTED: nitric oxide synthase-interacting protein-like [Branchiostoma belcheri]|uniref:Nitric oxide synthase-interacting protein n=1 Tax=Branchiostoma belcheri TaxID=7741 RepID=A0A6P4ZLM2_BRABE|nr:PREDICTED: nitric oxide synthase-interacting protein-like [Branchiostoma belcheri]XP_019631957.1 PREDICTED: nitric oxide synthase-interacting protein-like [Branchiostoma belcheri]